MPKRVAHHAVTNGVNSAVTTTEVAIRAVAEGATGTYCGASDAITAGTVTAAPAVEPAATPAVPLPFREKNVGQGQHAAGDDHDSQAEQDAQQARMRDDSEIEPVA